jgi:flagellar biosynthesis chaperone FliJ
MFFKTEKSSQLNIFSNSGVFLSKRSLNVYEDKKSWHNLFREQVTFRIDEDIFRPLFHEDNGAPNSSICVLISMMALKEAQGLSDAKLFEECQFNLLTRSALGLLNVDDKIPAESTYYLFRKRIVEWEKAGNENLIEKVFSQITKLQAIEFQVNGKNIRMDSKLIGSNISWYSRYELIHEMLRKAYSDIKSAIDSLLLCESERKLLENILGESGDKVVYRSNKSEIESRMSKLGTLIYKIIRQLGNHSAESVQLLCRIFKEQYIENKDVITPRPKEEISADSVQSPHDTECHFRSKGDKKFKGYSANITETCDGKDSLNLITNVDVSVASTADCDFLQPAIEATQKIVSQKIEIVNTDGAYHSPENQDYCKEKHIDLILGAIQGKPPRYDLVLDDKNELIVTDLQINTIVPSCKITPRKDGNILKWKIKTEEGKNRYFTQKEIDTCSLRKQITTRTQTELNVRNNVEASVFQLGYHYPNAKSRYRGLIKHKIWANSRCIWVNFVRIMNFIAKNGDICVRKLKNMSTSPQFLTNFIETIVVIYVIRIFCPIYAKKETKIKIEKMGFL